MSKSLISIIVPCYNEEGNVEPLFAQLTETITKDKKHDYEVVYVNDGSKDDTLKLLRKIVERHENVRVITLSRNFGKEIAITAGIHYAKGDALLMVDADGQHPPETISEFVSKWEAGAKVVTGVRLSNQQEGPIKKYGSKVFHSLFNKMTGHNLVPGSTDFRLIDKAVQREFMKMTERSRITRGLIDWLGFPQDYVYFDAKARMSGKATYDLDKLVQLALDSFVSLSLKPLYFSLYVGAAILPLSLLAAAFSVIEMVVGDPLHLNITGSGYLGLLIVFLVGLLLVSQGITALYLSHIHIETQNRPLFIVDESTSHGITFENIVEV